MSRASRTRSTSDRSVMSPTSKWTPASSSSDMMRRSRRASLPRSNAVTSAPSRTSARTVHAPIQPSAPVTRKRSLAVVMRGRSPYGPVSGASNRPAPAPQRSATAHANDGSNGIFVPGVTSIARATGTRGSPCPTNRSSGCGSRGPISRSLDSVSDRRLSAGCSGRSATTRRTGPSNGPGRWGSAISTWHPCVVMGPRSVGSVACSRAGHETTSSCRRRSAAWSDRRIGSRPAPTSTGRRSRAAMMRFTPERMAGGWSSITARTVCPVARGESRAARTRADRHGLHPRSRRPLAGGDRRRLSRACTGSVSRVSSVPSASG